MESTQNPTNYWLDKDKIEGLYTLQNPTLLYRGWNPSFHNQNDAMENIMVSELAGLKNRNMCFP